VAEPTSLEAAIFGWSTAEAVPCFQKTTIRRPPIRLCTVANPSTAFAASCS
jgi:hypothetical protein